MANLDNLITILWTVPITGSNGTEKYFISRHQYEVIGATQQLIPQDICSDCPKEVSLPVWIVDINGEHFLIDKNNAQFEGRVREDWETDWNIYKEKKPWEQPKNYNEVYKQVYGIDRNLASQRQDNGYEIWKQIQGIK